MTERYTTAARLRLATQRSFRWWILLASALIVSAAVWAACQPIWNWHPDEKGHWHGHPLPDTGHRHP